jgi:hypothetical protein
LSRLTPPRASTSCCPTTGIRRTANAVDGAHATSKPPTVAAAAARRLRALGRTLTIAGTVPRLSARHVLRRAQRRLPERPMQPRRPMRVSGAGLLVSQAAPSIARSTRFRRSSRTSRARARSTSLGLTLSEMRGKAGSPERDLRGMRARWKLP